MSSLFLQGLLGQQPAAAAVLRSPDIALARPAPTSTAGSAASLNLANNWGRTDLLSAGVVHSV